MDDPWGSPWATDAPPNAVPPVAQIGEAVLRSSPWADEQPWDTPDGEMGPRERGSSMLQQEEERPDEPVRDAESLSDSGSPQDRAGPRGGGVGGVGGGGGEGGGGAPASAGRGWGSRSGESVSSWHSEEQVYVATSLQLEKTIRSVDETNAAGARQDPAGAEPRDAPATDEPKRSKHEHGKHSLGIDPSLLDQLFPGTAPASTEPERLGGIIVRDTFASGSERRAWHLLSRQGSLRRHNLGGAAAAEGDNYGDSYIHITWAGSHVREVTLKIVRGWMERDAGVAGRRGCVAPVGAGGGGGGGGGRHMFNWDLDDGDDPQVTIAELLARSRRRGGHNETAAAKKVGDRRPDSWAPGSVGRDHPSHAPSFLASSLLGRAAGGPPSSSSAPQSELARAGGFEPEVLKEDRSRPQSWNGRFTVPPPVPPAATDVDDVVDKVDGDDDDGEWGEMVSSPSAMETPKQASWAAPSRAMEMDVKPVHPPTSSSSMPSTPPPDPAPGAHPGSPAPIVHPSRAVGLMADGRAKLRDRASSPPYRRPPDAVQHALSASAGHEDLEDLDPAVSGDSHASEEDVVQKILRNLTDLSYMLR